MELILEQELPPRKLHHRKSDLSILLPNGGNRKDVEVEGEDDITVDAYSTDEFRMYDFKVRRCMRGRSHDWTDCPFAHPGEKARRRDPRKYHYSGTICPDYRRTGGSCPRGDDCEFAHGVFECWLHPARYRTMPCKDGRSCRRKVCFFAHTRRQLRVLPSSTNLSPTSTLMGFSSPPASPPISPYYSPSGKSGKILFGNQFCSKMKSRAEVFEELISRLRAMELSPGVTGAAAYKNIFNGYFNRGGQQNDCSSSNCVPDLEWVNELLM